jgi:hypothetical protein
MRTNNKYLQLAYKINEKIAPAIRKAGKIVAKETAHLNPEDALAVSLIVRCLAKGNFDFAVIAESSMGRLTKEIACKRNCKRLQ